MVTYGSGEDWEFSVEENRIVHDSLGDHSGDGTIQLGYNLGDIDSSLATYYTLEEGQGRIARDGALNNFAQFSGTSWTTDSAVDSNALDFASGDYAETPFDTADIVSNEDLSVALWIKPDSVASSQSVINNYGGGSSLNHFIIELGGGNGAEDEPGVFLDDGSTGNWHQSTGSVTAGAWNHIGFSYEQTSNTLDLYVDGVQTNSVTYAGGGIDFGQRSIAIGIRRNDFSTLPYAGLMDDIRIYDRALSQYEFQSLANQTVSYTREVTESDVPSNSNNGVFRYELENDATDTWNANDATLNGSPVFIDGIYGQAITFDGTDDFIGTPISYSSTINNSITMAFWIRERSGGDTGGRAITTDLSEYYGFWRNGSIGSYTFRAFDSAANSYDINVTTPQGEWVHLVGVLDITNQEQRLYKNGQLLGLNSFASDIGTGDFTRYLNIGVGSESSTENTAQSGTYTNADMDDIRLYNAALTSSEAEALFNLGAYRLNADNTLQ